MTLGSDLVAKARSAALKKNRKVVMAKAYRSSVGESSSHTPVAEEETRERSSSSTIEKDISDDDNLNSGDTIFDYYTYSKAERDLSSSVILRRELGCQLKFSIFLVLSLTLLLRRKQ